LYQILDQIEEFSSPGCGPFLIHHTVGPSKLRITPWIVHQLGEEDGPASGKRPPRPPQMQGGWVPVPDGFFPGRLLVDLLQRQSNFNEFLAALCHRHSLYCFK
jgi:hypothetical protein